MRSTKATTSTKDVFIEALSLPGKSRAALAHKLLTSLERNEASAEIEAAWDREAESRYQAFKKGKIRVRGSQEVMRAAYKRVR